VGKGGLGIAVGIRRMFRRAHAAGRAAWARRTCVNGIVNMTAKDHMGLDSSAFIIAVVKDGDWQLAE